MAIIGFVSQKGGVSKSSLARALAVEGARGGLTVRIADVDSKQGSTTDWHKDRVRLGHAPTVDVQLHRSAKAGLAQMGNAQLLVVDGPARADAETLLIAREADLVVQPCGASLDDLRPAVRTFHALVAEGIPNERLVLVLSRVSTEAETAAARNYLMEAGYRVVTGAIYERPTYRAAQNLGLAITEAPHKGLREAARAVIAAIIEAVPEVV